MFYAERLLPRLLFRDNEISLPESRDLATPWEKKRNNAALNNLRIVDLNLRNIFIADIMFLLF